MRSLSPLYVLLAALVCAPGAARADDMDGWCAQVKKASSVVICSDAELRQQASARNKLFEAARAKLSPEAYRALTVDQSRWIKSYTARCGISVDDPPPPMPIPQSIIDCYRRESRARTAYLATSLSEPNPMASTAPNSALAGAPGASLGSSDRQTTSTNDIAGPWGECLGTALDSMPGAAIFGEAETRPAAAVVDAAFAHCQSYESAFAATVTGDRFARFKAAFREVLLQQVNANRTAGKEWVECLIAAADALADQPEPAEIVAEAAYASCFREQNLYQKAAGLNDGQIAGMRRATLPRVLAQVMVVRAAGAKLRQENPQAKPAIDYGRM